MVSLFEKSLDFYSIRIKDRFYSPKNIEDLISEALAEVQQKAYTVTKFKRELENQSKNKAYGLLLSYSPEDYVLVAEEGAQNANVKTKLAWLGPYQVVEVISANVYQVKSITGKLHIVHDFRIWFYSHQKPLGGALEVENILDIKSVGGRKPQYKLQVRSLGFIPRSDTWKSLVILYQDIPMMVRHFLEKSIPNEDFKVHLLTYLGNIDRKKY
eukprot:maker-scaffold_3-snap-gene-6.50-mRNA-1 protein AED:0.19 eAED:0.19 QI:0/0/0/0.66/0/0/3/0/212